MGMLNLLVFHLPRVGTMYGRWQVRDSRLSGEQGYVGPQAGSHSGQHVPVISHLDTWMRWVPRGIAATQAISLQLKVIQPGFGDDDRDIMYRFLLGLC